LFDLDESPFDYQQQVGSPRIPPDTLRPGSDVDPRERLRRNSNFTDPVAANNQSSVGATYNSILRTASFSGISNGPFANRLDYGASPTYRQNLPTSPRFYGHTQPAVNILERFSQVADATRDAEILKSLDNLNISHDNNNINYHQYQHQPVSTTNGLPNLSSTSSTYSTQSGPILSSQAMPQVNHALLSSKSELNSPSIVSGVTYRSSESFNSPYITPSPLYGSSEYLQQKSQDDANTPKSHIKDLVLYKDY
jgi:hypothetical protein